MSQILVYFFYFLFEKEKKLFDFLFKLILVDIFKVFLIDDIVCEIEVKILKLKLLKIFFKLKFCKCFDEVLVILREIIKLMCFFFQKLL